MTAKSQRMRSYQLISLLAGACALWPLFPALAATKAAKPPAKEVSGSNAATGYLLSVTLEKPEVSASEPVVIRVAVKNGSKESISYILELPEKTFKLSVKDAKGREVPLTAYGKRLFGKRPQGESGTQGVNLKPGAKSEFRMLVNRIYDMTVSGTYTIVARRAFPNPREPIFPWMKPGGEEISSNAVKVYVGGFDGSSPSVPTKEEIEKEN